MPLLDNQPILHMKSGLWGDFLAFTPELILCAGIILMLLIRLFRGTERLHMGTVALVTTVLALGAAWTQWQGHYGPPSSPYAMFTGLLVYDQFTIYIRLFLLGFAALTIWLTAVTGIPDREDSADFYSLILGATIGMMMMASANHLLMVYIAVEMASLPSYALAGFLRGRRQSSEASLKYVVYGGAASGVMLYGISLIAGRFGTAYLPDVANGFLTLLPTFDPVLLTGTLLVLIGLAFKLAAVPFHFWCPDVFEGASAEVAGFLSVASKGAALALLARFGLTLAGNNPLSLTDLDPANWEAVARYLGPAIAVFAALTATFGNLAAYGQTNLKRLLAYSTIAHAGYMMMALAPLTPAGADAMLVYLVAYLFMNLGAFAIVAFIRNRIGSEDLADYGGMIHRAPLLTIALAVFLLSLVGIPPLIGFPAKFQVFAVLWRSASEIPSQSTVLLTLLAIGLINTVVSLFYYVKVLKVMILDPVPGTPAVPEHAHAPVEGSAGTVGASVQRLPVPYSQQLFAGVLALVTAVGIFFWGFVAEGGRAAVSQFRPFAAKPAEASPTPRPAPPTE